MWDLSAGKEKVQKSKPECKVSYFLTQLTFSCLNANICPWHSAWGQIKWLLLVAVLIFSFESAAIMAVKLKNGRQLGRDGMLNVVESLETLCQPRTCKGKTISWQRQLNRLVKSGTIKTTIWVLSKHGSGALRNDSCIICLQITLRATSGTGWKQFRKQFYTEGLLGAEMYRENWNERINNSINNLPTAAIRHDMKMTWKLSSTVYFIPIRKIWGVRGESRQGN